MSSDSDRESPGPGEQLESAALLDMRFDVEATPRQDQHDEGGDQDEPRRHPKIRVGATADRLSARVGVVVQQDHRQRDRNRRRGDPAEDRREHHRQQIGGPGHGGERSSVSNEWRDQDRTQDGDGQADPEPSAIRREEEVPGSDNVLRGSTAPRPTLGTQPYRGGSILPRALRSHGIVGLPRGD